MNRKPEMPSENYSNGADILPKSRTIGTTTSYATVGMAVSILVQWLVAESFSIQMPEPVVVALSVVLTAIGTLIGGYLAPPTVKVKTVESIMSTKDQERDATEH